MTLKAISPDPGVDPRLITGACSMISWSRWGLHGNTVELIRARSIEQGYAWCELSQRQLADWLGCDTRYARRVIDELVRADVVDRVGAARNGRRGHWYRLRDPRLWRRVPWRFDGPRASPDSCPEIVVRRLKALTAPGNTAKTSVVARYSASGETVAVVVGTLPKPALWRDQSAPLGDSLWRDQSAPLTGPGPSSTSSGATGETWSGGRETPEGAPEPPSRAVVEGDGGGEEGRPRPAGSDGYLALEGAAAVVARAIIGKGFPVAGGLVARLRREWEGVEADMLPGDVVEAVRMAAPTQMGPALATIAWQQYREAATLTRGKSPTELWNRLNYLRARHAELDSNASEAAAEGDRAMVEMFTREQAGCDHEMEAIEQLLADLETVE